MHIIDTQRLQIKSLCESDINNICLLRADSIVQQYTKGKTSEDITKSKCLTIFLPYQEQHGFGWFSVFLKSTKQFIGQVGLFHVGFYDKQSDIELGYQFHRLYWGKGYATEAVHHLLKWGHTHVPVDTIIAFINSDNDRSRRVLEKCQMSCRGPVNCYYGRLIQYERFNDLIHSGNSRYY